ncbi:peroxiredoxin [Cypionkella aquatica]|uniref:thioredoxin-dependent peroxiredoxin n=1 Tax=Cypionkella aquatica TaxID=1756042 RepID=A0AA37TV79_9RHOB|nr:peroxiredoxin-like family protein [Cypionkella aquatica]GLS88258.1 peroxiredoxin [Cypionkella aquatica]
MTLNSELRSTVDAVKSALPAPIFAAIGQSVADLEATGITNRAAKAGTRIALPTLADFAGGRVDLAALAEHGPLVLVFYRGGWCPYCNVTLKAFERRLDDIRAAGAAIVAITPELPENAQETAEKSGLEFPVLIDTGNAFARSLGLVFDLPQHLVPLYRQIGIDLADWNGDASNALPIPATYIVDASGVLRWSHVEADFTQRAEPADVLAVLTKIA